jgi:hypothetical protein
VDVAIRDDSGGFDPEQLPRMGERFHRPLGGVGTGSGLGLSIARAVARCTTAKSCWDDPLAAPRSCCVCRACNPAWRNDVALWSG